MKNKLKSLWNKLDYGVKMWIYCITIPEILFFILWGCFG